MRLVLVSLLLLLLARSPFASAQAQERDGDETRIANDGVISGRLDAQNPRDVFTVDGLRGEVIGFALTVTDGNLDPVLRVFNDSGQMTLHHDDSGGRLGANNDLIVETTGTILRGGWSLRL